MGWCRQIDWAVGTCMYSLCCHLDVYILSIAQANKCSKEFMSLNVLKAKCDIVLQSHSFEWDMAHMFSHKTKYCCFMRCFNFNVYHRGILYDSEDMF